MKVITFERNGARSYGLLNDDHVVDVGSRLASRYGDLRSVLDAGVLSDLTAANNEAVPTYPVAEVKFLP
ncbi:MAG: 5-carboxymethyl-2-hydroxymuconate isomerase, partial [Pseudolabrys sp.]